MLKEGVKGTQEIIGNRGKLPQKLWEAVSLGMYLQPLQ